MKRTARLAPISGVALFAGSLPVQAFTIDAPVTVSEPGTFSLFAIAVAAAVIVGRLRRRK